MSNTVLVGAQWGDEGKGKIIDVLAPEMDVVVRYQGGNNAGHTVTVGDEKYVLRLLPSGILHPGKHCVLGNGVVIDPLALVAELTELAPRGISPVGRFHISDRAHIVFPFHGALDTARDTGASGELKIGTTKRGIGPAYGDKAARVGLRMGDLVDPIFPALLQARVNEVNRVLRAVGAEPVDGARLESQYRTAAEVLAPYIADTVSYLDEACRDGKSILFEGAQGTMLDIDFGTYPYVTSSSSAAGGACTGTGVPPQRIDRVVGVIKAYTTRVGEGPFPTEISDESGQTLARVGKEFGAVTGRPRRCGWFDAVVARYTNMINGFDCWAMTKLDVMDTLPVLKIGVAYECDGVVYDTVPGNIRVFARCKPIYEEMEGWLCPTGSVTRYEDLPAKARAYVERLCALTGVKLGILSVGPKRASTLRLSL